jgi:ribonuclease G
MSEELFINITPKETRVAIVENGVLQEIFLERASKHGIVGNIYSGRVVRVLPGMQAAFVDMGLDRAAFLHLSDMISRQPEHEDDVSVSEAPSVHCITQLLKEGQDIVVQVIKDPLGTKGARISTRISLPSRFLVFMPDIKHVGVSQRIEDEAERERLRLILTKGLAEDEGGYIIRTAAEGIEQAALESNKVYLRKLWKSIQKKVKLAKSGQIIHEDLPLALRALRDSISVQTERIRIDDLDTVDKAIEFAKLFVPNMFDKIEHFKNERPIFDFYNIEDEIQRALQRKVLLKSGGYLIFDQTEAMTTIDVNTGAFVGSRNLEETIFKTNLEAGTTIARQLRLRNLGGIIIIDFIDMIDEEHKRQVLRSLEKALAKDYAKTSISQVSALGLVEMTRKRTRESLEHVLCQICPLCEGRGSIKSVETVCNEIFREVLRTDRAYDAKSYLVLASQIVVDKMLDEDTTVLTELQDQLRKSVQFQVESLYTQEQFDVVLM